MPQLKTRKSIRLKDYDYSQNGAYFVTICVKGRHELLGEIIESGFPNTQTVGGGFHAAPDPPNSAYVQLSQTGAEVAKTIEYANNHYDGIEINQYVIMPNHVHMIVFLTGVHGNPPLPNVVGQIKSFATMKWNELCGTQMQELWQRGYYDHIIRTEQEYMQTWQYIDENPAKWTQDEYYAQV